MNNMEHENNTAKTERPIQHYEFPYMRKPKQKRSIWRGIYNPDKNYILGRTPKNWGSLLIFYTIFYAVLAALFAICIQGLLATLSDVEPKWKLDSSRIGTNPGLGSRPNPENTNRGVIISFDSKNPDSVNKWVNDLQNFLEPYANKSKLIHGGKNQIHCDYDHRPIGDQTCMVDINNWSDCSAENGFGYNRSAPCILLKINRIYNWLPKYYNDINNLPNHMPEDLKEHIKSLPIKEREQVWISCTGDKNTGPIKYYHRGFPGYFYPFTNAPGYLSPLAVIQLERPAVHTLLSIECRVWAKNIIYSHSLRDRQGSVYIEFIIDT